MEFILLYIQIILVTLTFVQRSCGQTTVDDLDTCTYSFVVPQVDLMSTCDSMVDTRVDQIQSMINGLQDQVRVLHGGSDSVALPEPTFSCGCNNKTKVSFSFRDCEDVKEHADGISGVYDINLVKDYGPMLSMEDTRTHQKSYYVTVENARKVRVYCDLTSDDAGWLVIMRRVNFNVSFDRTWQEYKDGFGDPYGDFWLGLENMHDLTSTSIQSLWIVLHDEKRVPHIVPFDQFVVASEENDYSITTTGFHGSLTDRITDAGEQLPFVTKDSKSQIYQRYYDEHQTCANSTTKSGGGGGWWFKEQYYYSHYATKCGYANLNAIIPTYEGLKNVTKIEMKILPRI